MRLAELVETPLVDDELPLASSLNPYILGSTPSAFGHSGSYGVGDPYLPRTANEVDHRLIQAVKGDRMVLLVGPSKAGKSRTLFEAVRAARTNARLLAPIPGAIGRLAAHQKIAGTNDSIVVWLDDLDRYLTNADPLTPGVLAWLSSRPGPTFIVATLRSEARDRMRRETGEFTHDTRTLLSQAVTIELAATNDDPTEQAAAAAAYPTRNLRDYGLGAILAGAPELLARYDDARVAAPVLHAVIQVAIDWARIGHPAPITEATLRDHTIDRLATLRPDLDITDQQLHDAIVEARTPPPGAGLVAALLIVQDTDSPGLPTDGPSTPSRHYRPFDYLVAADDGQDHSPRLIPNQFWDKVTRNAGQEALFAIGVMAYERNNIVESIRIFRQLAEGGDVRSTAILGDLLLERGDLPAAETMYRKAADSDTYAMVRLGVFLSGRGDLVEAETFYRTGADAGDSNAMDYLGELLADRGDLTEAETWYRKATDTGNASAMVSLGVLLANRDDLTEAETWYRKAADTGHLPGMVRLGELLANRDDLTEAETWRRKAADTGKAFPMARLGDHLANRGNLTEAETWYRKAADTGNAYAMARLGDHLANRGDPTEAETWHRKAADTGNAYAMVSLGDFLADRDDPTEAETWYRKAADNGNPFAMVSLGNLLADRDDLTEAETWYCKAADAGHPPAMIRLGNLLADRGDPTEAETWYRKAADTGDTSAMVRLGDLLADRGDPTEAETWYRKAADTGNPFARVRLRDLLAGPSTL
ncbi:tetratricopeptide repeat protein [Nocardia sp. NPDC050789]|uniref:tetratricopeptide repeat protein n=1 Tax=Nocardia sp. NPDC050789 TaxID=3154841 RepID=UPI00340D4614